MRHLVGTAYNIIPAADGPIAELIVLSEQAEYDRVDKTIVSSRHIKADRVFVTEDGLRETIKSLEALADKLGEIAAGGEGE